MQKAARAGRPPRPDRGATLRLLGAAAALLLCGAIAPAPVSLIGERIYREGQLASGEPLRGAREGAPSLQGPDAACVQCHRRSGLGMVEGQIVIPPIAGRFLFAPGKRIAPDSPGRGDATHLPPTPPDRVAYDEATLARAIREGIGANGRPLDYLMPRFDLDDGSMRALIAYLGGLSKGRVPGVTDSLLHFATIVTPDADPAARAGMRDVLEKYFAINNDSYHAARATPTPGGQPVLLHRQWRLHVWQLTGAPDTWEAQLDQRLKAEPVFAVVSGVGGGHWEPVHRFCERQSIPCLLPNVDLPVVGPDDFYPIYFSEGVLLEARLIATRVPPAGPQDDGKARVVQVFRDDDIGAAAAARLCAAVSGRTGCVDRVLGPGDGPRELARAVQDTKSADTLVLWLRSEDLKALPDPAAGISAVYASGVMGGLERAPLAPAWRSLARITYPFELPEARSLRLGYPLGWFRFYQVPLVAERVQVDTYIACTVLSQALTSMLGDFERDYLVERVEALLESRIVNGYYTRLGLAPGQRFASKGGYLVRFVEPTGVKVAADGDWIVPWSTETGDTTADDRKGGASGH
jgi:hypothetical protein